MEMFSAPCDQILHHAFLARAEYKVLKKSGVFKSNSRNYKYSIYDDYIDACLASWFKYKLHISHHESIHEASGMILIETRLTHTPSSQWMRTVTFLSPESPKQQDYGSALSYKKRYQVDSLLGLGGAEDDEAILGDKREKEEEQQAEYITQERLLEILQLIAQSENPAMCKKRILWLHKIDDVSQLPDNKYDNVKDYILHKFKS